jgi:hypothetical protein
VSKLRPKERQKKGLDPDVVLVQREQMVKWCYVINTDYSITVEPVQAVRFHRA